MTAEQAEQLCELPAAPVISLRMDGFRQNVRAAQANWSSCGTVPVGLCRAGQFQRNRFLSNPEKWH
jgi:hypothetical protein